MEYKHYIFSAAKDIAKNLSHIDAAKKAIEYLDDKWSLENDCVLCAFHSRIEIKEDANISIILYNSDLRQLIADCMEYAVEYNNISKNVK